MNIHKFCRKPQFDKEGEAEIKGQIPEVAEELLNEDVKGKLAELDKLLQEGKFFIFIDRRMK